MSSIIIIVLFVIVLFCFGYIFYLKYFKRHTRERFAFMGMTVITALVSTLILQIYSAQGYVSAYIYTSNFLFSTNLTSYQTDFKDHILTIVTFWLVMRFILKLHKNWDGPISETLFNKLRFHENPTIFQEAFLQFKDFISKDKTIIPHIESEKNKNYNIFTSHEDDKMPWHENVYELLTFANQQYKIDLQKDYYPDQKCFISKYGLNNENIAVLCSLNFPNDITIRNFILFAKSLKIEFSKFIIAVKHYDSEILTIKRHDTEIIILNEGELLNTLIDFTSYKQFIKDSFTAKEITVGSNKTLQDIYVPLIGKSENNPQMEIESYVGNWLQSNHENKHLAILGEYGCGKSVVSLKITFELLENLNKHSRIPILIELRGKSPRNLSVTEILSTWAANYRIDVASLLKLHKAGKLVIIFEGFDEMDMIGDKEMRLNHFQRLWEFAIPKSKIIITGRPNFFLDDKELKMNLGIEKPYEPQSHYCEAIHLEKFDIDQIKLALRNIDQNTKEQVLEILKKPNNSNFYDLVSRPSILYLVAVLWKERKLSAMKDNINSAVVISEFIKYSYSRQSNKNTKFPLTEKEREYFMLGISVGMLWLTGFSNQINKANLENLILKLYKNFPDEIASSESAMQPKRKPLRERMVDNNQAEETVLTDVRSCGILVNDLTRKDYFKFAHKSFLEYQASLYFVESILQDKGNHNIMMNAITNSLDITVSMFKHSQETISFTSEILISKLNLNKSDNPHKVCKRLFTILYPYKLIGKQPYLAALFDMYFPSTTFFVYTMIFPLIVVFQVFREREHTTSIPIFTFIVIGMIISLVAAFLRQYKINVKRSSIWLQCCHQLNILETTIITVVPKRYISFLEGNRIKDPMTRMFHILFKSDDPLDGDSIKNK
jgi:hypothetical protein